MTKTRKKTPVRPKRSVAAYLLILFVFSLLLLTLAYFTQERAYAHTAAQIMTVL